MLDILKQYLSGIVHYWWLLIIGLLGAVNSVYKWFHPDRKDFPIPHWLRIYSAIGALILAQFLIYRDSIYNLNTVILQKQSYASENWHLRQDLSTGSRSQAIRPLQSKGTSILSASSQSTAKNQSTPTSISTQPQIIAPSATQTPFESLIQVNKNFPTGDRERLSNALYDYSQELESMAAVGYQLNRWKGQLDTDIRNNSLGKTFAERKKELKNMNESAKVLAKSFIELRDKWKYYERQQDYVFGDNPDNNGPNALINAMSVYTFQLDQWAALSDRDNPAALNLLKSGGVEYTRDLNTFFKWERGSDSRLAQMKHSLQ